MGKARLELTLTNASGGDLNSFVRIELFSAETSMHYQNNVQVQSRVSVGDVDATGAGSIYRVALTPSNYPIVQFFVTLADGQTTSKTVPFPVDPTRVAGLQTPQFDGLPAAVQTMPAQREIPPFGTPAVKFTHGPLLF